MKDETQEPRRAFGWTLPASVAVHAAVVALVIFGLPVSLLQPEEEKAVDVDLVPPEEAPKPPEQPKAEPPPAPKQEEAKTEPPPATPSAPPPQSVLQPVYRFGEKDAGPRDNQPGNSAEEGSEQPDAAPTADEQKAEAEKALAAEKAAEQKAQEEEALAAQHAAEKALAAQKAAEKALEAEKAEKAAKAAEAAKPKPGRKQASRKATGDVIATTAIDDLPRGVRAGRLCVTELREQLNGASPPYFPDLLPSYRLTGGNVLDVPDAAFRMFGAWYALSYRCEVDAKATRVVDFGFRVGGEIPPSEWARRGLPAR